MPRNFNRLKPTRTRIAVVAGVLGLLATGCMSSSSATSAATGVCETGRINSPEYQPYSHATNNRNSWGGIVIKFANMNNSGVISIITAWRAQSSSWQWVESNANTPEQLRAHHDAIIMQVGNGALQVSERFFATDGSATCNGQLPQVLFGAPAERYGDMLNEGLAPKWNSDTTPTASETAASVIRLPNQKITGLLVA